MRGNAARQRVLLWDTPKHHSVALKLQENWRVKLAKDAVVEEKIIWGVKKVRIVTVQCAIRCQEMHPWTDARIHSFTF